MPNCFCVLTIKYFDLDSINYSGIWIGGCLWEVVYETNKQTLAPGYFQKENRTKKTNGAQLQQYLRKGVNMRELQESQILFFCDESYLNVCKIVLKWLHEKNARVHAWPYGDFATGSMFFIIS